VVHDAPVTAWASVLLLIAVLAFAVARPGGLPEVVAAAPAALLVVVLGLVPWHEAGSELVSSPRRSASWRRCWFWRSWPTRKGCSASPVRWSGG
jgi:hypothetical protein